MAYSTPPTFSSSAILTAGQLNILADDIEYLNSLSDYVNLPFNTYTYGIGGPQNMQDRYWVIRHRNNYLHYLLTVDQAPGIVANLHLDVAWAGTPTTPDWKTIISTASGLTSGSVHNSYFDLTGNDVGGSPLNIPLGAFMRVRWSATCNGKATAVYFLESAFTTI